MTDAVASVVESPAWATSEPILSVLIPFLRDDPRPLLEALDQEAAALSGRVEIVVMDDGTGDAALTAALEAGIRTMALPATLLTLPINQGRAKGRNRLAQAARGHSFLFLDSDMRPDSDDFLSAWADLAAQRPPVIFGGFSLLQAPTDRRFAVHRALAGKSECLPADVRALTPEKYVFTSNLLVRRDVFDSEAFDPAFTGWGWEDVEWAMRVSRRHPVAHVDNAATHMGLDTVAALAGKYEQSSTNFARVVAKHPDIVAGYPSYKVASLLKRLPGLPLLRRALKGAALAEPLPVGARAFALRLYRASLYSGAV